MSSGYFSYPLPVNEPVLQYLPGSKERETLKRILKELKGQEHDIPMVIGGREVHTGKKIPIHPPHDISHTLGHYHGGEERQIQEAIEAALAAREGWRRPQTPPSPTQPVSLE